MSQASGWRLPGDVLEPPALGRSQQRARYCVERRALHTRDSSPGCAECLAHLCRELALGALDGAGGDLLRGGGPSAGEMGCLGSGCQGKWQGVLAPRSETWDSVLLGPWARGRGWGAGATCLQLCWLPSPGRAGQATLQLGSGVREGHGLLHPPVSSPRGVRPVRPLLPGTGSTGWEPWQGRSSVGPGARSWTITLSRGPGPWARPSPSGLSFLIRPPSLRGPHQLAHLLPC